MIKIATRDKRTVLNKWSGIIVVISMVMIHAACAIKPRGRQYASEGCQFPGHWSGTWFQKGVHPLIRIEKDIFSFKGKCHESNGFMFYIQDSKQECFRCILIHEKHQNVLQYRETYCDVYRPLIEACASLSADAILYSLFRVDAVPVPCEIQGPFTFSYSRGGRDDCKYPVSTVDSCTDESRLLFRFQACAEVLGTESSVEELSCLALWKEGPIQYLVGKMTNKKQHNPSYKDNNAYRCFVFETSTDKGEIHMSQNNDATCDGLVSPLEGSRTMKLTKKENPISSCNFPSWVTTQQRWNSLDGHKTYNFYNKNSSFKIVDSHVNQETKFICISEIDTRENISTFITHGMVECESGFVCVRFYKRHKAIIEIQLGSFSRSAQEACQSAFTENIGDDLITLIGPTLDPQNCPSFAETQGLEVQVGKFSFPSRSVICGESLSAAAGCQIDDTMRFLVFCASYTDVKSFQCHGHWEEHEINYLVTTLKDSKEKYCFVYKKGSESITHVSAVRGVCPRTITAGVTGNFTFNITAAGECDIKLQNQARDTRLSWTSKFICFTLFLTIVVR